MRNGWGNARDVNTVYDDMKSSRERRLDDASMDSGPYVQSDMDIFDVMIHRRQKQQGTLPKVKLSSVVDNAMASAECSDSRSVPKQVEVREEAAPVEDSEVEETVYETVIEPEDLWSSLDEALTEMGYDVYTTAIMLKKGKLPEELVALVAAKVSSTADRVRPMLEAQCPALLPAVMALIEKIRKELELQRIAQEEMERADEIEREILRHKEKSRRQEAVLERVQMIGRCCMGYEWIKVNNGYRCAGKLHFVSDAEVGLV